MMTLRATPPRMAIILIQACSLVATMTAQAMTTLNDLESP